MGSLTNNAQRLGTPPQQLVREGGHIYTPPLRRSSFWHHVHFTLTPWSLKFSLIGVGEGLSQGNYIVSLLELLWHLIIDTLGCHLLLGLEECNNPFENIVNEIQLWLWVTRYLPSSDWRKKTIPSERPLQCRLPPYQYVDEGILRLDSVGISYVLTKWICKHMKLLI